VFCLRSISIVRAHARNLRLHSRLRASPPCPPRSVVHSFSLSPTVPHCPPRLPQPRRHSPRAMRPRHLSPRHTLHDVLPLAMAPSAIAAQICLTHEGEDQIRSTMATRNRLRAMDLYEILLLTIRPAHRASTFSIYRCGSCGPSLYSATRSSKGGGARGAPDRCGGRGRGHGRTLERMGSASMRWGVSSGSCGWTGTSRS
jgi:hypothetical protein